MKEISAEKVLLSPAEAGQLMGLSSLTIRTFFKEGDWDCIPHIWSGNSLKIFAAAWREVCATGKYEGVPITTKRKERD